MKPNSYGILHVVFNVKNQYCRQNSQRFMVCRRKKNGGKPSKKYKLHVK